MDQVIAERKQPLLLFDAENEHGDAISGFLPVTLQLLAEIRRLKILCRRFGLVEATVNVDVQEAHPEDASSELGRALCVVTHPCRSCPEDDEQGISYSYLTVDDRGWITIEIDDGSGNSSGARYVADGLDLVQLEETLKAMDCDHVL